MTEIYLIRHAQSEGNLYRLMQGHWNGALTPLGLRQLDALAERMRGMTFDAVYSSDLTRARMTAEAVTRYSGLPIRSTKALREIDVGPWEGCFFGDLMHDQHDSFRQFLTDVSGWKLDGAETCEDVAVRFADELTRIAEAEAGKTVAVVSHGAAIRYGLCRLLGIPMSELRSLPIPGNTAVSRLTYSHGKFTLVLFNDCSHTDALAVPETAGSANLRAESFDPASDPDHYTACYRDAWYSAHGSVSGFSPAPYYQAACEHYAADPRAVLRVYNGEASVGLIDLDTQRGAHAGVGWISLLYLAPELRGRDFGIQLLARAIMLYSSLGRTALRLHVAEDNTAALKFYRRWGFRELSSEPGMNGRLLLMEKKLGVYSHE